LDLPFRQFDSQKDDASFCSKCQTQTRFATWFAKPFCQTLIWHLDWANHVAVRFANWFAKPFCRT
jgi:hypothetical protein